MHDPRSHDTHDPCHTCGAEGCPGSSPMPAGPVHGWRMVVAALALFLLPAALGLGGSLLAGPSEAGRLGGALAGVVVGLVTVVVVGRRMRHEQAADG